jgi:hypothetical protein
VLDETSYLQALYLYLGAAGAFLLYMSWILARYWRAAWVCFTVLLMAALLLTPAYPDPTITTFAPALIVALFESMINGVDAAQHAVKPLGFMLCLALVLSLLLRFTLFRKHSQAD